MASNGEFSGRKAPIFREVNIVRPIPQRPVANAASKYGKKDVKPKKAPKKPVTFALDPKSLKCILVEHLEEKEDVKKKNSEGKWVPEPFKPEQRTAFDRDSVLYYFQCILRCPTNLKFITARIIAEDKGTKGEQAIQRIRPLKIEFTSETDAQSVMDAYNKNVLKL